jgi:hypothetical protein
VQIFESRQTEPIFNFSLCGKHCFPYLLKSSGFSEENWVMPAIIHNYQVCTRTNDLPLLLLLVSAILEQ